MKRDSREVRDDDVTRNLVVSTIASEVLNVFVCLRFGLSEILTERFMFDEDYPRPKEINVPVVARDAFYGFLKACDHAALNAKNLKEFVPESLFLRPFACDSRPLARKLNRIVADLIPGNR